MDQGDTLSSYSQLRVWRVSIRREAQTYASHRRGRGALSPPMVLDTLTIFTERQDLHCKCNSVALEDSCDALMTIPGRRTSVVRVFAFSQRLHMAFLTLSSRN